MTNIRTFTDKVLDDYASGRNIHSIRGVLEPVRGYFTARVYQFHIYDKNSLLETYYIKESGDRSVQRFNDFIDREYKNTKHVFDRFRQSQELATTCPIAYSPEHLAFIIEKIEGERVDKLLVQHIFSQPNPEFVENLLDRIVEWLTRFQEIDFPHSETPTAYCDRELDKLAFLESRINLKLPERDKPIFTRIFRTMEATIPIIDTGYQSNVIKHNDFAPWNMIFDGERLTVIDYADCGLDFPLYDLLYFRNSLGNIARKMPFTQHRVRRYQDYLAIKCNLDGDLLRYYKAYFYLQDIEFVLRGVSYGKYTKFINYLRFRRLLTKLLKTLDASNPLEAA